MTDIFLNDKNNCNLDESACKNKPNARMTADALLHKDVLNQVLAKDRHYIKQKQQDIKKQLKMNFDDKAHQKSLAHLAQIIDRSQKAVNKRREDIPKDLANKLNQDLPVTAAADVLIDAIKRHQVIIVAGETGSQNHTAAKACHDGRARHHRADWAYSAAPFGCQEVSPIALPMSFLSLWGRQSALRCALVRQAAQAALLSL